MPLARSDVTEPQTRGPRDEAYISPRSGLILELFLRGCDSLAAKLGRSRLSAPHLQLGERGEEAAAFHLRRLGYVVVARRWRSYRHPGDVDLIAWEGATLCFIEVKARSSHAVAEAETAVDRDKRRNLRRIARHYMRYFPVDYCEARFDVVTVYFKEKSAPEFHLFRGAFGWSEHREGEWR